MPVHEVFKTGLNDFFQHHGGSGRKVEGQEVAVDAVGQGVVLLVGRYEAVPAEARLVGGKHLPVGAGGGRNPVIRPGSFRVEVEGQDQPCPLEGQNLRPLVLVKKKGPLAVRDAVGLGKGDHLPVKGREKAVQKQVVVGEAPLAAGVGV